MNDEGGAQPISTHEALFSPEQVQKRLGQLDRGAESNARRDRIKLMFDVLDAIAKGTASNPRRTAAAVVRGVGRDPTLRRIVLDAHKRQINSKSRAVIPGLTARLRAVQGLENLHSPKHLFENAEKIRDHITIAQPALDFLYKNSRCGPSSQAAWERDVRTATSIDHIIRFFFRGQHPLGIVEDLANLKATEDTFERLKTSKATLLLTFHGGFVILATRLFAEMKTGLALGRHIIYQDTRSALFTALRALQDGCVLITSPDGVCGNQSAAFNVLGKTLPIAKGAAYLAYESNCNTAWYTVVREGEGFKPIIEPGPSRSEGETFDEFCDRLYRFYSERIEAIFTGDPRSIVLRQMWTRVLQ